MDPSAAAGGGCSEVMRAVFLGVPGRGGTGIFLSTGVEIGIHHLKHGANQVKFNETEEMESCGGRVAVFFHKMVMVMGEREWETVDSS
ncbi:hypothetical protein LINPERHAP1_LOCUS33734 [Linum perenne]